MTPATRIAGQPPAFKTRSEASSLTMMRRKSRSLGRRLAGEAGVGLFGLDKVAVLTPRIDTSRRLREPHSNQLSQASRTADNIDQIAPVNSRNPCPVALEIGNTGSWILVANC